MMALASNRRRGGVRSLAMRAMNSLTGAARSRFLTLTPDQRYSGWCIKTKLTLRGFAASTQRRKSAATMRRRKMDAFELQIAYDRRGETIGRLQEQNEALTEQNERLHKWNAEKEKRIAELEAENAQLCEAEYMEQHWKQRAEAAEAKVARAKALPRYATRPPEEGSYPETRQILWETEGVDWVREDELEAALSDKE
jgi:hypothetical protein